MNKKLKERLEKTKVFVVNGTNTTTYFNIGGYLVPEDSNITTFEDVKAEAVCSELKEARYLAMLCGLKRGKSIENFKRSKYYEYYLERLKEEHPEYII